MFPSLSFPSVLFSLKINIFFEKHTGKLDGEGYIKWNKEKLTKNQQWSGQSWDQIHPYGLEHKEEKNIQSEQQEEKKSKKRNKDRLRSLWDNSKGTNIRIIRVLEGEEKKQEFEKLFEKIIKGNFSIW